MGIVMATVLLGIVFFKERLSAINWVGIALALVSIFLFSYDSGIL
jgi:multidrug transporter EmrE-like cation transporter